MIVAMPMPPPTHNVTIPRCKFRASNSSNNVPINIAPVAPSGCPIAIAPPFTLTFSNGMFNAEMNRNTTAENASLTSNKSMSSQLNPAIYSAFSAAGAGPVSMIVGSVPTTAVAITLALGVS